MQTDLLREPKWASARVSDISLHHRKMHVYHCYTAWISQTSSLTAQELLWHWHFLVPHLSVWPLAPCTLQATVVTFLCMPSVVPQAMRDSGVCLSISLFHSSAVKLSVQHYLGSLQPRKTGKIFPSVTGFRCCTYLISKLPMGNEGISTFWSATPWI